MLDERDRVERLRALAASIEHLPPSAKRDKLLWDVRTRTVALDTGSAHRSSLFRADIGNSERRPLPSRLCSAEPVDRVLLERQLLGERRPC